MASLVARSLSSTDLVSGALNNVSPDVALGSGAATYFVMIMNTAVVPVTNVKAWLGVDTGGVTVRVGLASGSYAAPVAPGSYSIPTSDAGGLLLSASIAAGGYVLVGIQVDPSSGTTAWPENNVLYVAGDGPI